MSLYDDLGVKKDAGAEEIKAAHRRLAKQHHPDKEGGDTRMFQVIQHAYDVLSDAERRKRYDESGDDKQEKPLLIMAMQQLSAMLFQVIDNEDIENSDLLSILRSQIQIGMGKARQNIEQQQRKANRYEQAAKRMQRKRKAQGPFILADACSRQAQSIRSQIASGNNDLKLGEEMLKILDEHEYRTSGSKQSHRMADMLGKMGSPFG